MEFHELEEIRDFYPEQLKWLSDASASASASASVERAFRVLEPHLKKYLPKPKKNWDRTKRRGYWLDSIEHQFGGQLEADFRKSMSLILLTNPDAYKRLLSQSQACLDGIFAGETANMQKLLSLFYAVPRKRLSEILKDQPGRRKGREIVYRWRAVLLIMKTLLNEPSNRHEWAGGKARRIWLSDRELRTRVLTGIEARINTLSVPQDIRSAFLDVIHAYLP
jgi:hypothetical protein